MSAAVPASACTMLAMVTAWYPVTPLRWTPALIRAPPNRWFAVFTM